MRILIVGEIINARKKQKITCICELLRSNNVSIFIKTHIKPDVSVWIQIRQINNIIEYYCYRIYYAESSIINYSFVEGYRHRARKLKNILFISMFINKTGFFLNKLLLYCEEEITTINYLQNLFFYYIITYTYIFLIIIIVKKHIFLMNTLYN